MQKEMEKLLQEVFSPSVLELANESAKHRGHAGHREAGGGDSTHFKLTIVSTAFAGKSRVERHRMVYAALVGVFDKGVHALAIDAKVPGE